MQVWLSEMQKEDFRVR